MGFSNCIYKFKNFKDTTLNQIFNIESYYSYDSNEWAKKNFKSAEDYMNYNNGCNKDTYIQPTQEQIEYYKQFIHNDEFGHLTIKDYVYENCSAGMTFHQDIQNALNISELECSSFELYQSDIIKLLAYEINQLKQYKFEPAFINSSFTFIEDEENSDDDNKPMIVRKCDGVEITFDDGTMKRVETNSEYASWGTLLMTSKDYIDEDDYYNQIELIQSLSNILTTVDFETECLIYCGGW